MKRFLFLLGLIVALVFILPVGNGSNAADVKDIVHTPEVAEEVLQATKTPKPTFTPGGELIPSTEPRLEPCPGFVQIRSRYFLPYSCFMLMTLGEGENIRVIEVSISGIQDRKINIVISELAVGEFPFWVEEGKTITYVRAGDYERIEFRLEELILDEYGVLLGIWLKYIAPQLPEKIQLESQQA